MKRRALPTNRAITEGADLDSLEFWENGLLPVVTQDADSDAVLMVAFANREALEKTLQTGQVHYWSRSRKELWHKGATSGNVQILVSLHADCDRDTLLARVRPLGPACHTGEMTCFGEIPTQSGTGRGAIPESVGGASLLETLPSLWRRLEERASLRPEGSYTVRLLEDENLRLKKLGEETAELILALARDDPSRAREEGADLLYHLLVAMMGAGTTLDDLLQELSLRMS